MNSRTVVPGVESAEAAHPRSAGEDRTRGSAKESRDVAIMGGMFSWGGCDPTQVIGSACIPGEVVIPHSCSCNMACEVKVTGESPEHTRTVANSRSECSAKLSAGQHVVCPNMQ